MDEINNNSVENEDNNSVLLLLRECFVLLDSYHNCLTVMSNNCKCDQNIEIKLLFNDLLTKYKTIITNNITFIENTFQNNYLIKFRHLFDCDLSEPNHNNDKLTIINHCFQPNVEQTENNPNIDDNNNANNDDNVIENEQTVNECNQQINEENPNITETVNQNFEYISKSYLLNNKSKSIKSNIKKKLNAKDKSVIRCKIMKSKLERKTIKETKTRTKPKCFVCELEFEKKPLYIAHNRDIHHTSPFKCEKITDKNEICGKSYKNLKHLINHIKTSHCGKRPVNRCENFNNNRLLEEFNNNLKAGVSPIDSNLQSIQPVIPITSEMFACDKCYQFIRVEERESHNKAVHNLLTDTITIDICYICELEFNKRSELISHNKELHYNRPYKCEKLSSGKVCGRVFSQFKNLSKHVKKVHYRERPFKCSECDKDFPSFKQLTMHKKRFHGEERHVCDWKDCDYATFDKYLLERHQKRHLIPKKPPKTTKTEDDSEKIFKCSDCGKEYKYLDSLNGHRNQVHLQHKYVCDWEGCGYSTPKKRRIMLHKNRHLNIKSFHCEWPGCEFSFVDKWTLYQHGIRHSDIKFCCPHCNKSCKTNKSLKQHIMGSHSNEKPFECDLCQRKYATKRQLYAHMTTTHSGKQHKCAKCDYKTYSKPHLAAHDRRVHLRERTFICHVKECEGKRFFGKKELLAHHVSVHSDERKFVCNWPECGAAFKLKGNLTVHLKCHTGQNVPRKRKTTQ